MSLEVSYYPGCTGLSTERAYVKTALMVLKDLGVKVKLLDELPCCGTLEAELVDISITKRLASLINREAGNVVTGCSGCYSNIRRGGGEATHLLYFIVNEVGLEEIKKRVKRPLKLKVAPYYGCQALRPKFLSIDDPEDPSIFEELLKAIGAEPVEFDMRTKCCGGPISLRRPLEAKRMAEEVVRSAEKAGAEVIATMCNLCHFMLDYYTNRMPVLHFTQLVALAFGHPFKEMGFEEHFNRVSLR